LTIERVTEADITELLPLMRAYCDFYEVAPSDDDLLALSREESAGAPTEVIRLDELARAASGPRVEADTLQPAAVKGDRAALERALANLVRNAEL